MSKTKETMTIDVTRSNSLTDLVARIKAEHDACALALKRGLEHAVACGRLLIEAKEQIPHGQVMARLDEKIAAQTSGYR